MKLYRTPTGHWAGTKDDAAFLAKTHNTTYEQCEVPYDKAGLLAFLNDFQVGAEQVPQTIQAPVVQAPQIPQTPHPAQKQWDRLAVEEFMMLAPLDTAVALAELVMSRIRDFTRGK